MFLLDASTSAATPTQSDDGPSDSDNNDDALLLSTSGEGALLPLTSADDMDNISVLGNSPLVGPAENKSDSLVTVTRKKRLSNPPQTRVQELLEELFPGERSRIHHQDVCDAGCTFSRDEISRQRKANNDKQKEKVFTHGYAKLLSHTVQQADTGGLFLCREKGSIASYARSTMPTPLKISKKNSP